MQYIDIIFTGGTISMKLDPDSGSAVPALSGQNILERLPDVVSPGLRVHEYGKYPGPHITPAMMAELARRTMELAGRDDCAGVILTHGTDTLEETAYFLDLSLSTDKPVLLVGSMNHADSSEYDGPKNLQDAARVIESGLFRGMGVMTCLGGEINAASEVTKTHTQQRDTFMSFDFGPVGRMFEGRPVYLRQPYIHEHIGLYAPADPVYLMKCYAGMDAVPFRAMLAQQPRGIVVEAMGTGNVPPGAFDGVREVLEAGIPVVVVSRCPRGKTDDVYGYYGAGKKLREAGAIFAPYLNGQKARIKLMLAVGSGRDREGLQALFAS